jgi:hypothetical protein
MVVMYFADVVGGVRSRPVDVGRVFLCALMLLVCAARQGEDLC